jgi:beta-lactamase regulating signal transducer with metallopeptidase domain
MIERAIAVLLINALWEPLAVAACAFAVLRIASKASAATRCAVLTIAIVAALLLPPITTAFVYSSHAASAPVTQTVRTPVQSYHVAVPRSAPARHVAIPQTTTATALAPQPRRFTIAVSPRIVMGIVAAWAAVALLLLVRLLVSLAHLSRLRRDALPLSPDVRAQLRRWSEKAGGIDVRLCLSDETIVPIAVGLFDCMVLLPRRLLEELDPVDLDRVVLHEIAHLRRRDGVIFALQQIAAALYFFSPGLIILNRALDIEREIACDDWVLERSADAAPYANCLLRLAEQVPWPHKAVAAPGAFVTRRSMSIRIERILHRARDLRLSAAPAPVAAAVLAAGIVTLIGLSFAPSLAYPTSPQPHTVAVQRQHHAAPAHPHVAVQSRAPVQVAVASAAPTQTPAAKAATAAPVQTHVAKRTVVKNTVVKNTAVKNKTFEIVTKPAWTEVAAATPNAQATGDYIDEMRAIFGNLSVDDLVALKSVGVTPDYARQLRAAYPNASVHTVIGARSVGLTTERMSKYRSEFGNNLSFDDMMALASLGVDPAYRDQLQAAGLQNLTARQLIELKSVGVTPDYIRKANAFGFGRLTEQQLVELKSEGIDSDFIQRVKAHGFNNLTLEQIIELKSSGVIKK